MKIAELPELSGLLKDIWAKDKTFAIVQPAFSSEVQMINRLEPIISVSAPSLHQTAQKLRDLLYKE